MTEKFQGLVNLLPSRAITKPDDDDVEPLLRVSQASPFYC